MTEAYLRLFGELNEGRYDSREADDAVQLVGAHGHLLRGLARARRHAWAGTRADMIAAGAGPGPVAPLTEYIAGIGRFVARDYHGGMQCLVRAASSASAPAVAGYARDVAVGFARALGWVDESLALLDAAATTGGDLSRRTRELQRRSAIRQRAQAALIGTPAESAGKAWRRTFDDGALAAAASLDVLLERHPNQLDLVAARVRVHLLLGEFDSARGRLAAVAPERLVHEHAALALAVGEFERVLELTEALSDDPRLLHLRGEALLSTDAIPEAATVLERARVAAPESVAILLSLAVARHREAPDSPSVGFEHRFDDLLESAPALLADAAGTIGIPLWTDEGRVSSRADAAAILVRARAMLTDDQDVSRACYRREGGPLRQVVSPTPPQLDRPTHRARLHTNDQAWIDRVQSTLVSAIGINPAGPTQRAPVVTTTRTWTARSLTPAQIDQFLADGMLTIPRAFDPELARAWRSDANRRIREEPSKWVRGYDPGNEAKSLRNYSPDQPNTWTWPRIDLEGPEVVDIEKFSPNGWAAICDLLGGPERIKSKSWSNYLVLNFNADAGLGIDRPEPDWASWHIDDPHPAMRLDRIRNGLVCITLFDTLLPASGNTWLALDSVGRVVRELADHPEGVDFVHDRGARITVECERFHEVVGETGDLLLFHPLMMHSGSPNRSGRIRWMGNPMVYLEQPLNPLRADESELSVVELSIRRAMERSPDSTC